MRRLFVALFVALVPAAALADDAVILVSPAAAFSNPDMIATNIKVECGLPTYQAGAVHRQMEASGVAAKVSDKDEVPGNGRFLMLRIENAMSAGNAFIGHRKQVTTSAKLYDNGKEVARSGHTRDSMGGFGAGFKGSCAVLQRCADTLAIDITTWLKGQLASLATAAPPATK